MRIESQSGDFILEVELAGDRVRVQMTDKGDYLSDRLDLGMVLSRDEARMLHTDLGEMLGKFEVSGVEA